MKIIKISFTIIMMATMCACASVSPQGNVIFDQTKRKNIETISISMTQVPEPQISYPGANCLLCLGLAAAANNKLSSQVDTFDNLELVSLADEVNVSLNQRGVKAQLLDEPVNVTKLKKYEFIDDTDARKDHRVLVEQFNTTHLLVLNFDYIGIARNYSSYIPVGDPYSLVSGFAYLVDLSTNKYEWYLPINEVNSVGKDWKEPPQYPGLTNSFYKGVASIRDQILTAINSINVVQDNSVSTAD